MKRMHVGLAILLACVVGCGKSKEQQQAEQLQKTADQMQKGAEDMAKGLEQMAKGLNAMAGGDPNQKPADPVEIKDLQAILGQLSGWERGAPSGDRFTSPVNYSEVTVKFTKGDAEIEQKVVDSALNQALMAPFALFLGTGYQRETSDGFERALTIGDYPGWEKWSKSDMNGELGVVVKKRFLVQIEGRGIDDTKVLHAVLDKTDLKKLAALK